jgi:hypothetical protein
MRYASVAVVLWVLLAAAPAAGRDFSGTHRTAEGEVPYTLTLVQAGENLRGTLVGQGKTISLAGTVEEGVASGQGSCKKEKFFFVASFDEDGLTLRVMKLDKENEPDYETGVVVRFPDPAPPPKP